MDGFRGNGESVRVYVCVRMRVARDNGDGGKWEREANEQPDQTSKRKAGRKGKRRFGWLGE